ncbi:hypothetical protein HK097_005134 [Rhizophlyctis rosea]|uniref:C2H2-type domain-containing protein n=1 Tax=Rhizophlyctis rosea TaxID=64517 RepID=A0AAD5X6X9_9FUNG|nr:hypothetical protein HK097_005134 [Rhizophlyctis rosea]
MPVAPPMDELADSSFNPAVLHHPVKTPATYVYGTDFGPSHEHHHHQHYHVHEHGSGYTYNKSGSVVPATAVAPMPTPAPVIPVSLPHLPAEPYQYRSPAHPHSPNTTGVPVTVPPVHSFAVARGPQWAAPPSSKAVADTSAQHAHLHGEAETSHRYAYKQPWTSYAHYPVTPTPQTQIHQESYFLPQIPSTRPAHTAASDEPRFLSCSHVNGRQRRCECGGELPVSSASVAPLPIAPAAPGPLPVDEMLVDEKRTGYHGYHTPLSAPFATPHPPALHSADAKPGNGYLPRANSYEPAVAPMYPHPDTPQYQQPYHERPDPQAAYLFAPIESVSLVQPVHPATTVSPAPAIAAHTPYQPPILPSLSAVIPVSVAPRAAPHGFATPPTGSPLVGREVHAISYVPFSTAHHVGQRGITNGSVVRDRNSAGYYRNALGSGSGSGSGEGEGTPTPPPIPTSSGYVMTDGRRYEGGKSVRFDRYPEERVDLRVDGLVNGSGHGSLRRNGSTSTANNSTPTPASTPRIELPFPLPYATSPTTVTPPQNDANGMQTFSGSNRGRNEIYANGRKEARRSRSGSAGRSRMPSLIHSSTGSSGTSSGSGLTPITSTPASSENSPSHKRYICSTCGKRFSRPSSLKTHTHSHTGERPYVCGGEDGGGEGCGRRFSVLSNLRRHMRGCRGRVDEKSNGSNGSVVGKKRRRSSDEVESSEDERKKRSGVKVGSVGYGSHSEDDREMESGEDADGEGSPDDGDGVAVEPVGAKSVGVRG